MNNDYDIGLSALLESDITTYEYFYSLPNSLRNKIESLDLGSYEEIQKYVRSQHESHFE